MTNEIDPRFSEIVVYIGKNLGKSISYEEASKDLKAYLRDRDAREKISEKYSTANNSFFSMLRNFKENPEMTYFNFKASKEIATWANKIFYGSEVVKEYDCYSDIWRAYDIGDIDGSALCHTIAQRKKGTKIGDATLKGETIYQALAKVINFSFGGEKSPEDIPLSREPGLRGPSHTISQLWWYAHTNTLCREPTLIEIFKNDRFNKEAYSNHSNKEKLIKLIEGTALNEIIMDLKQDSTRREILENYWELEEKGNQDEIIKNMINTLVKQYETYKNEI